METSLTKKLTDHIQKFLALGELPEFVNETVFELEGWVVPKARPRLTKSGHAYLPKNYRDWKDNAINQLAKQICLDEKVITKTVILINFIGSGRANADTDNLQGSILDALVQAEILEDDNRKIVPLCIPIFTERGKKAKRRTIIRLLF